MRAHQIMLARVDEALRPFGLTFARYEMLMLLLFSPTRGAAAVEDRRPAAGAPGQRHERRRPAGGARASSDGCRTRRDRRATLAEITDAGRDLALDATEALNLKVFAAPGLEPQRVDNLVDVLRDLRRSAGDF